MKKLHYDLVVTDTLMDRVKLISAQTGISVQAFIETAVYQKTIEAERSPMVRDAFRDEDSYPYRCDCGRRFKLAAHLANHIKACDDMTNDEPAPEPEKPKPKPNESTKPTIISAQAFTETPVLHPDFKLGVDPSLIEMDGPTHADTDESAFIPSVRFTDDVPDL